MPKPKNFLQLVTANRLNDGLVVFLNESGDWTESIDRAKLVKSKEDAESLLKERSSTGDDAIIEPYLIDVEIVEGTIAPVRYREKLRGLGPTVRTDLGRQSEVARSGLELANV